MSVSLILMLLLLSFESTPSPRTNDTQASCSVQPLAALCGFCFAVMLLFAWYESAYLLYPTGLSFLPSFLPLFLLVHTSDFVLLPFTLIWPPAPLHPPSPPPARCIRCFSGGERLTVEYIFLQQAEKGGGREAERFTSLRDCCFLKRLGSAVNKRGGE